MRFGICGRNWNEAIKYVEITPEGQVRTFFFLISPYRTSANNYQTDVKKYCGDVRTVLPRIFRDDRGENDFVFALKLGDGKHIQLHWKNPNPIKQNPNPILSDWGTLKQTEDNNDGNPNG